MKNNSPGLCARFGIVFFVVSLVGGFSACVQAQVYEKMFDFAEARAAAQEAHAQLARVRENAASERARLLSSLRKEHQEQIDAREEAHAKALAKLEMRLDELRNQKQSEQARAAEAAAPGRASLAATGTSVHEKCQPSRPVRQSGSSRLSATLLALLTPSARTKPAHSNSASREPCPPRPARPRTKK